MSADMNMEWVVRTKATIAEVNGIWVVRTPKDYHLDIRGESVNIKCAVDAFNISCVDVADKIDGVLPHNWHCNACHTFCRLKTYSEFQPHTCPLGLSNFRWGSTR